MLKSNSLLAHMCTEYVPLILLLTCSGGGAVAFRTLVPYPMDTVGLIRI
jgi:hypothetical protein